MIKVGYHISRKSVIRVKPILDQLVKDRMTIKFPSVDPDNLAYLINQGIRSSQKLEIEEYIPYRELDNLYRFKRKQELGFLIAEFIDLPVKGIPDKSNSENIKRDLDKKEIPSAISLIDVMASIISNPNADEIYFPNASLDRESKIRLYGWTKEMENSIWKYIDQGDRGAILTKSQDVPWEILFKPLEEGES